jgi:RNA polymerase sigma-70 factor, ECF subfamily
MTKESDESLVLAVQQGSEDAFRELVLRYQNYILTLIFRQVLNRATAEEIAQEVFVQAFKGLANFRQESSFKTWITRIALNRTTNYLKSRQGRNQRSTVDLDALQLESISGSDNDPVYQKELLTAFTDCLATLSHALRECLVLIGLQSESYEEVAAKLAIPIGTVRSRLNRARILLGNCLAARGISL